MQPWEVGIEQKVKEKCQPQDESWYYASQTGAAHALFPVSYPLGHESCQFCPLASSEIPSSPPASAVHQPLGFSQTIVSPAV